MASYAESVASPATTMDTAFWGTQHSAATTTNTSLPGGGTSSVASSSSASPRKKFVVGGQVSRRVGQFSPMLEEDETGTFSSPSRRGSGETTSGASGGGGLSGSVGRSQAGHSPVVGLVGGTGAIRRKAAVYESQVVEDAPTTAPLRRRPGFDGAQGSPSQYRQSYPSPSTAFGSPARPVRPSRPPELGHSFDGIPASLLPHQPTASFSPTSLSFEKLGAQALNPQSYGPPLSPSSSRPAATGSPSKTTRALVTRFETPLSVPPPLGLTSPPAARSNFPTRSHLDKPLPAVGSSPSLQASPSGGASRKGVSPLRDGLKKLVGKFGGGRRRKKSGGGWESGTDDEGLGPDPWRRGNAYMERPAPVPIVRDGFDGLGTKWIPPAGEVHSTRYEPGHDRARARPTGSLSNREEQLHKQLMSPDQHQSSITSSSRDSNHSHSSPALPPSGTPPLRTGQLLFFASTASPPHWVRTTATLFPGLMTFASADLRGDPISRTVPLKQCEMVRSVPEKEARGRWTSPLRDGSTAAGGEYDDDDDDEVHYLELVFRKESREAGVVVAVSSVGERLGWVSSIWDAIASPALSPLPPSEARAQQDSPQDSLLDTPPLVASAVYDSVETSYDDRRRSDDIHPAERPTHIRRVSEDAPRLRRPKLGSKVDEIRLSVERMFEAGANGTLVPFRNSAALEELSSEATSSSGHSQSVTTSSGLSRAERMEHPGPLVDFSGRPSLPASNFYPSSRSGTALPAIPRSDSINPHAALFSPTGGPSPSLIDSEAHSFDPSDLNPSRSASQIKRPTAEDDADRSTARLAYRDRPSALDIRDDQFADIITPARSSLVRDVPPSEAGFLPPVPQDITPVIQLLSSNEANSSQRSQLFDLKLSSVQDNVSQLLRLTADHETEDQRRMQSLEASMAGIGIDLKEVVAGLQLKSLSPPAMDKDLPAVDAATTPDAAAQVMTDISSKLDIVLAACERLLVAKVSAALPTLEASDATAASSDASTSDPATEAPAKRTPPPVLPIQGVPGGPAPVTVIEGTQDEDVPTAVKDAAEPLSTAEKEAQPASDATVVADTGPSSPPTPAELMEILTLVREQQAQRSVQTQQTSDIARYLNELNTWMEQFVRNGNKALDAVSDKVDHLADLISPPPPPTPEPGSTAPRSHNGGVVGILNEVRTLAMELRDRTASGGDTAAIQSRLEAVFAVMDSDRQRFNQQNSTIDSVLALVERQRLENQQLLSAMVVDLKQEIQGERIRFVDAMQHATSVNVNMHVEEFKKVLSQEVSRSMADLGRMREEKKALEHQIAELFAIKVKNNETLRPTSMTPSIQQPRRPSYPMTAPGPPPTGPPPPTPQGSSRGSSH